MSAVRVLTFEGENYFGVPTLGRVKVGTVTITTFLRDGVWYTRVFQKGMKRISEDKTVSEEEARENHCRSVKEHSF